MKDGWRPSKASYAWHFYEAFQAYRKYLEEKSDAVAGGCHAGFEEHKLFEQGLRMMENYEEERAERERENLARAQKAARCQHRYLDGARCRAPRV